MNKETLLTGKKPKAYKKLKEMKKIMGGIWDFADSIVKLSMFVY